MNELQLAIYISRISLTIAEINPSDQRIVKYYDFDLAERDADGYRAQLKECFAKADLREDYAEYSLAWSSPKQTLVPLRVFNESSPKSVFHLMFGEEYDEKTIDFNRLMELQFVSVFEIPDWIKAFFVMKFPKITIKHENTIALRALFQGNTFKRKVVISISDEYITVNGIYHNELTFSNSFEYQNSEDILYHLLFVLEKEDIQKETVEFLFLYASGKTKKWGEETMKLMEKHGQKKGADKMELSSAIKLQVLCV